MVGELATRIHGPAGLRHGRENGNGWDWAGTDKHCPTGQKELSNRNHWEHNGQFYECGRTYPTFHLFYLPTRIVWQTPLISIYLFYVYTSDLVFLLWSISRLGVMKPDTVFLVGIFPWGHCQWHISCHWFESYDKFFQRQIWLQRKYQQPLAFTNAPSIYICPFFANPKSTKLLFFI